MKTTNKAVKAVALAAFPDYKGRKFFLELQKYPIDVCSYWGGGSRDYFNFVRLDNLKVFGEVPQQSAYDKPIQGADKVELPPGLACVCHSYFCGKDTGLTVYINPVDNQKYLPVPEEKVV
jgi:hypothetical protein